MKIFGYSGQGFAEAAFFVNWLLHLEERLKQTLTTHKSFPTRGKAAERATSSR
jgi:hypothetical protein